MSRRRPDGGDSDLSRQIVKFPSCVFTDYSEKCQKFKSKSKSFSCLNDELPKGLQETLSFCEVSELKKRRRTKSNIIYKDKDKMLNEADTSVPPYHFLMKENKVLRDMNAGHEWMKSLMNQRALHTQAFISMWHCDGIVGLISHLKRVKNYSLLAHILPLLIDRIFSKVDSHSLFICYDLLILILNYNCHPQNEFDHIKFLDFVNKVIDFWRIDFQLYLLSSDPKMSIVGDVLSVMRNMMEPLLDFSLVEGQVGEKARDIINNLKSIY